MESLLLGRADASITLCMRVDWSGTHGRARMWSAFIQDCEQNSVCTFGMSRISSHTLYHTAYTTRDDIQIQSARSLPTLQRHTTEPTILAVAFAYALSSCVRRAMQNEHDGSMCDGQNMMSMARNKGSGASTVCGWRSVP